jgi:gluconolactonase
MDGFESRDRFFARYVLANAPLEELATGFRWIEGPVWMGDADCLLFQDIPRNRTMRWTEAGGVTVFGAPSDLANGQTRDRQRRLIACSHRGRCLYRTEPDGRVTTLVAHHDGKRLNAPNDVVVKSDGTVCFSDLPYGIQTDYKGGRQVSEQPPALYCYDPAMGDIRGMRIDEDGNLWSSAADGVHCISPAGELLGKVLVPHAVSNLTFGGLDKNRLFIGGSRTLYAIFLNWRGVQWP